MAGSKPQLSTWEMVSLIPAVVKTVMDLSVVLVSYPFTSQRPAGLLRATAFAAARQWFRSLTIRQMQATAANSEEAYASAAKAKGFPIDTITLEDGTKAHWIGESSAKKVLLYFHGGGYVLYANIGHYTTLYTNVVAKSDSNTSVLFLSYDIAPEAPYPRQLQQAAMALQYLLKTRSPSTVLIGGDSAGGNLTAAILSLLTHPHPDSSVPKIAISEPLLGAVLVSPWAGFDTSKASFQHNQYLDLLPIDALNRWSTAFMGSAKPDNYNQPILAPSTWWQNVPVEDVLITGGDEEVLIDEIKEFTHKFKEGHPATEVLVAKGEAHDQLLGSTIMGVPPGISDGAVFAWIAAR